MKIKHNKKRNTAFVYEALIREATVAVLKNEPAKRNTAVSLIKKHFHNNSMLKRDLECYRSLYENQSLDGDTSNKILREVRMQRQMIDPNGLFIQQSDLIHDINKELSSDVFNNFVPNYRTLATIDQIFSLKTTPKNRVLLEGELIDRMGRTPPKDPLEAKIDAVVFNTFVKKFNSKYDTDLLDEQKDLLIRYIVSFSDNALELKTFLNEEIARLKKRLIDATATKEISVDADMLSKTNTIIERLDSYNKKDISEEVLMTILKTQALVKEIYTNGDND